MHVQRIPVEPADATDALPRSGYAIAFEVSCPAADTRSPEQWARAVFEQAPPPLRRLLPVAWRIGLGLRLGPLNSPEHVLGWALTSKTNQAAVLDAGSWLMTTRNVVELRGPRVRWTTYVRSGRRPAAALWSLALPVHKAVISYLMRRAATRG